MPLAGRRAAPARSAQRSRRRATPAPLAYGPGGRRPSRSATAQRGRQQTPTTPTAAFPAARGSAKRKPTGKRSQYPGEAAVARRAGKPKHPRTPATQDSRPPMPHKTRRPPAVKDHGRPPVVHCGGPGKQSRDPARKKPVHVKVPASIDEQRERLAARPSDNPTFPLMVVCLIIPAMLFWGKNCPQTLVKPVRKHLPRLRDLYPFKFKQRLLHFEATLKSAQLTI